MMLGKLLTPYCLASATSDILTAGMSKRSRSSSIDSRAARLASEFFSAGSSEKMRRLVTVTVHYYVTHQRRGVKLVLQIKGKV